MTRTHPPHHTKPNCSKNLKNWPSNLTQFHHLGPWCSLNSVKKLDQFCTMVDFCSVQLVAMHQLTAQPQHQLASVLGDLCVVPTTLPGAQMRKNPEKLYKSNQL